jgi:hypothetical protein
MRSHKGMLAATALTLTTALALGPAAIATDLPQSRSLSLHSGWKGVGEVVQVGENHIFGAGNFWGVTFNDAGRGPLHKGAVVCPYTLELMNGAGPAQRLCAWGDSDGDKFFTSWTGKVATSGALAGILKVTGGTGKFKGIQGTGAFQCNALNDKNQYSCTQQFHYSLPTVVNK